MSNKKALKAFVRFDGSGRVVAGSLILRKNKPKVGKWQEITGYECCNQTTTTTTTAIPLVAYSIKTSGYELTIDACTSIQSGPPVTIVYAAAIPMDITGFYIDPEGTTLFTGDGSTFYGFYKNSESGVFLWCQLGTEGQVYAIGGC